MRLERLVIDTGDRTLTTEFHPRLTVIGGLSPEARDALAGEIVDALAGARPGVHLELRCGGRSLTVFRPASGPHRVVDTDAVADVTADHLGPDGGIDLFAAVGTDRRTGRGAVRFGPEDLVLTDDSDRWVAQLAATDQDELWSAARRCRHAEDHLLAVSDGAGTSPEDAALVERIEERHRELVAATEGYERVRLIALTLATVGAIGGLTALQLATPLTPLPFVAIALVGLVLGIRFRQRADRAEREERAVLTEAGADDYAAFHYARVSALLDSDHERRRFMLAVGDHRQAMDQWTAVAGEVPLRFALDAEERIRGAARIRHEVGALHVASATAPDLGDDRAAELAHAVLARIETVRSLGAEGLPLVVDDPFDGMEAGLKPVLLELLSHHAGDPQLIVVTADDEVTSWARVEALTGEVAVVEPRIRSVAEVRPAVAS